MTDKGAGDDPAYGPEREADGAEAGRYADAGPDADADDQPQTCESLLQSVHQDSSGQLLQCAGIDDGLHFAFGAEHRHQIAHHRGLALVVELDDPLGGMLVQRHLDHRHGAGDDPLPRNRMPATGSAMKTRTPPIKPETEDGRPAVSECTSSQIASGISAMPIARVRNRFQVARSRSSCAPFWLVFAIACMSPPQIGRASCR